ncbi:Nsp1-like C-terminal region-domain-containing protein [Cladorrhinum sp. PSN259]|nr:Nsp1-like C-terminal region-domain-containing protein [Cladorrhinum sp. PSN259]
MSFHFGGASTGASSGQTPATSAPAAGSLFGATTSGTPGNTGTTSFSLNNTSTPKPGGLFGNTAATAPTGGSNLFGGATASSTPAAAAPASGTSLFGTPAAPSGGGLFGGATASKPATSGLFGNTSSTPSSGTAATTTTGLFGNKSAGASTPTATTPAATSGGLFGGGGAAAAPAASQSATSATGGGLFGATSALTPAKPTFGGLSGGLGSTTPAGAPPADASKPAAGGLFGPRSTAPAATSGTIGGLFGATSSTAAPAATSGTTGGLFGAASSTAAPTGAAPPAARTTSLFANKAPAPSMGGSLFGSTTTGTPAPAASTTTTAPTTTAAPKSLFGAAATTSEKPSTTASAAPAPAPAAGGLFGAKQATNPVASAATTTAAPAATTPSLFGAAAPATTAAPSTTTTTAAPTPAAGGLFGAKPTAGTAATPVATTTTATAADGKTAAHSASTMGPVSVLPRLKNKTMDEIITRWATDLSKYQKEFKEQAAKVSEWDRMLVENGEKIQKLYTSTFEAERASNEIERQLASVESQQEELGAWLERYEQELDDLYSKSGNQNDQAAGPDQERERTYKLAEKVTDRLDDMGKDLTKMIKEINDMSGTLSKGNKPDDPLSQIVRVLNGHLSQLQWIDTNAAELQAKVTAAQKITGNMGHTTSDPETHAAESFYRSYRGGFK